MIAQTVVSNCLWEHPLTDFGSTAPHATKSDDIHVHRILIRKHLHTADTCRRYTLRTKESRLGPRDQSEEGTRQIGARG